MTRWALLIAAVALNACTTSMHRPRMGATPLTIGATIFLPTDIVAAVVGYGPINQPLVNVRLSSAGALKLETLTRANVGKDIPILVGGKLIMSPRVMEPITAGLLQISGLMTVKDAQTLAAQLGGDPRQ